MSSAAVQCVFALKSARPCAGGSRLQTLDELDAANDLQGNSGGSGSKLSWTLLSRVNVNYLSAGGGFGHGLFERGDLGCGGCWQAGGQCHSQRRKRKHPCAENRHCHRGPS